MPKKLSISFVLFIAPYLLFPITCANKVAVSEPATTHLFETRAVESIGEKAKLKKTPKLHKIKQQQAIKKQFFDKKGPKKNVKQGNIVTKFTVINEDIYFDFDSSVLSEEAQTVLKKKAAWLRLSPGVTVIIEGHCDERGTSAYNLALGHSRAKNVMIYMTWLGISETRLKTISYGEERPADIGHNENAWVKNRRVHFEIEE